MPVRLVGTYGRRIANALQNRASHTLDILTALNDAVIETGDAELQTLVNQAIKDQQFVVELTRLWAIRDIPALMTHLKQIDQLTSGQTRKGQQP